MYSCSKNLVQTTKVLLDSKCNTEITDFEGKTAIIHACLGNSAECINLLIKAGANKESADKFGRTPLLIAMASQSFDASYALALNKCEFHVRDVQGGTPFFYAVYYKDTRLACYIMNNTFGIDVNMLVDGKVPLIHAIEGHSPEMVQSLLKLNARLDVRDSHGLPPLCLAASNNEIDIVKVFLNQENCDVDVKDLRGSTALMHASACGHIEMIKLLVDFGAKLEETNMALYTPLFRCFTGTS
ncbi:hypothetical protein TVAG_475370 [Trichomonas vaginalis G3]|uniref:Uncharacterized protein n=1 Tax=Trichomonas vaginalis (strain ATCC PRA-98 / G3) TaxID=412133 RepID=A2EM44_TRIV3|nr:protein ubiquitination [Trichomonas vaginalis G3]EAY06303.1 hypothetical protein TVAG_475370 [Trichomonas vaginalis G3]KAI5503381.1 protein ubiquitination [Trichomonas vaginalis G3]|eukprot:XP_001318526.1 hypothetical protein [Trichomonas vaginalis G3]